MQETVEGFLESPHPASLTCPGIKFSVFVISQSTWVQNIFKEERNMKRQSLDIGKARSFVWQDARRPLLISVLVSLSEMSAQGLASGSDSEWAVVERKAVVVSAAALAATARFFAISWCCFPMSTFLDTLQSRSGWHSGLQDITWHLLLMPQRKASKVTYYQHATITANMMDYQACCPHLKNKNKTSYNLKRRTGDNLAT